MSCSFSFILIKMLYEFGLNSAAIIPRACSFETSKLRWIVVHSQLVEDSVLCPSMSRGSLLGLRNIILNYSCFFSILFLVDTLLVIRVLFFFFNLLVQKILKYNDDHSHCFQNVFKVFTWGAYFNFFILSYVKKISAMIMCGYFSDQEKLNRILFFFFGLMKFVSFAIVFPAKLKSRSSTPNLQFMCCFSACKFCIIRDFLHNLPPCTSSATQESRKGLSFSVS